MKALPERQYLKEGAVIRLEQKSGGAVLVRDFTILKRMERAGASSLCYVAFHENSSPGVLKEFYPLTAYAAERDAHGQLVFSPDYEDARVRFAAEVRRYLAPYKKLLALKQNDADAARFSFIPAFEIYCGCDGDGTLLPSAYIWTPQPATETFAHFCEEIHRHPARAPEHKLVTVLKAIRELTRCLCTLHSADLLHRDINPSNFGFERRGGELLTQTLSLFDINSLCSVFEPSDAMGTPGYADPSPGAQGADADNRTDIYAIGATLFHAVIVSEETKKDRYLYRPGEYDRLAGLVDDSVLIKSSEANSHPRLRRILTDILRQCLDPQRWCRYENCEALLADLDDALYYALPSELARKSIDGQRWKLIAPDAYQGKDAFLAIQYHLYEHPLYERCPDGAGTLNVLVIGFGSYGQKFLDACLQNGQIPGKRLCVTVLSDDSVRSRTRRGLDKSIYLAQRPELAEFFNIDGSLAGDAAAYGDIAFACKRLAPHDKQATADALQALMQVQGRDKSRCPHYVFIALGDDALNLAAARACREALARMGADSLVSYACEGEPEETAPEETAPEAGGAGPLLCPVCVNKSIRRAPLYAELERMAFNVHLLWQQGLNAKSRPSFRRDYEHDSCISNVLSIKYKLHAVGLALDRLGFAEAARRFAAKMADEEDLRSQLIWVEHRRWVTEKLCRGWRRLRDLNECAGGMTRDTRNRRHVCICRSRPGQPLRSTVSRAQWDAGSDLVLDELDALDRLSVELHRMYAGKAREARRQDLLTGSQMAAIRTLAEKDSATFTAFREWYNCVKAIWAGDTAKVKLYERLTDAFKAAADGLEKEQKAALTGQIRAFETVFYPVKACTEYRDWKKTDEDLIDNIPFVLTYTDRACFAVPFTTGPGNALDNDALFCNVAAATVANPARILYLYRVETDADLAALRKAIPYVISYLKKKQLQAAVEFLLLFSAETAPLAGPDLEKELQRLGGGRIRQVQCRVCGQDRICAVLGAFLARRRAGRLLLAVEKNDTPLSEVLAGGDLYRDFAHYRFVQETQRFEALRGCDMLNYIPKKPYITVSDMISIRRSAGENSDMPEFYSDYEMLWKTYCKDPAAWTRLCGLLGGHAARADVLAAFPQPDLHGGAVRQYAYILPFACSRGAERLLHALQAHGIVEAGSCVTPHTSDSCRVRVDTRLADRSCFDRLFGRVYALMFADALEVRPDPDTHTVCVKFDGLMVNDVDIGAPDAANVRGLLQYFSDNGYLLDLHITAGRRASFTYATRQIKHLLTAPGRMLEVYTYHKARDQEQFSDIVSSFEIDWEGSGVRSKCDCILTRGFRSLFVACRACSEIDAAFYDTLNDLTKQFGINATPVLVADTRAPGPCDPAANAMQRRRGEAAGVVTIWKPEEIANIGEILVRVMDGAYWQPPAPGPAGPRRAGRTKHPQPL